MATSTHKICEKRRLRGNQRISHLLRDLSSVKKDGWKPVSTLETLILKRDKERIFMSKISGVLQFYICGNPLKTIKKSVDDFDDIYEVLEDYEENKEQL